jgi:hypothetical protein
MRSPAYRHHIYVSLVGDERGLLFGISVEVELRVREYCDQPPDVFDFKRHVGNPFVNMKYEGYIW